MICEFFWEYLSQDWKQAQSLILQRGIVLLDAQIEHLSDRNNDCIAVGSEDRRLLLEVLRFNIVFSGLDHAPHKINGGWDGLGLKFYQCFVLHHVQEQWHEVAMVLQLNLGRCYVKHQTQCHQSRVAHSLVAVKQALPDQLYSVCKVFFELFLAWLRNHAQESETSRSVLPILLIVSALVYESASACEHRLLPQLVS